MFYLASGQEREEAEALESAFGCRQAWTQDRPLALSDWLQLVPLQMRPDGNQWLLLNPETATWCYLEAEEISLCDRLQTGVRFQDLLRHKGKALSLESLREWLSHLYRRGLLAVNGQPGIDPSLYHRGALFFDTYTLELLLTDRCNLACPYCFASASSQGPAMSVETGRRAIDLLFELPYPRFLVKFGGGEPLLHLEVLAELLAYAHSRFADEGRDREVVFDLTTNATRITPEAIALLCSYNVEVYASLDGPPEVHDPIRSYPSGRGSHAEVQAGLSLLREYGYSPRILAVIGRHNVAQPHRLLTHLEELGVEAARFNPILRTGRAAGSWADYGISPEEYFTFMAEALDWLAEHRSVEEDTLQFLLMNLLYRLRMYRCQRSNCGAGRNYVAVDAEGNLYPCAMHRKNLPALQLGNIFEVSSLQEVHRANGVVREMPLRLAERIPACRGCDWRHFCTGGCPLGAYTQHGTLYQPSPLCEFNRRIYPYLLSYFRRRPEVAQWLVAGTVAVRVAPPDREPRAASIGDSGPMATRFAISR